MSYDAYKLATTTLGDLAYHEMGSGEPLIMHHGGESHKGQYSSFAPLLADGIRSISYDQRDMVDSFLVNEPYAIADVADDCIALMDALGIEKAHIMGISFGGAVTLNIGIRHPDRVQTLMVGAAPVNFMTSSPYAVEVFSRPIEERAELMVAAILSEAGQRDRDLLEQVRKAVSGRYTKPGSHRMGAFSSHDVSDLLDHIHQPTLLFYGDDDPLVPVAAGEALAAGIADSELVVLPGARHGLSFEFKETTAKLVSDFVLAHPID